MGYLQYHLARLEPASGGHWPSGSSSLGTWSLPVKISSTYFFPR